MSVLNGLGVQNSNLFWLIYKYLEVLCVCGRLFEEGYIKNENWKQNQKRNAKKENGRRRIRRKGQKENREKQRLIGGMEE